MKKKLHKLILFLLMCQLQVAAQTTGYSYEAPITPVDSSGFYNIVLTPELNAHLKTDYSDLRIVNDSGKWVPHLVKFPNNEMTQLSVLWERKILKNDNTKNATEVIIEGGVKGISNLVLKINNSSAERYCTLTGSDDMHSWFIINDSIKITGEESESITTRFILRFPPVDYKYFKVSINNNGKDGFKVLHAGTTSNGGDLPGQYSRFPLTENPPVKIFQKDSSNFSFIRIEQNAAYHFQVIELKVSGIKYFNRKLKIYIPASSIHSFSNPGEMIAEDSISNNSMLKLYVSLNKAKTFYIIIQNDDNLPLKLEQVKTLVDYHVAALYLEKGNHYKLLLDNPAAILPKYDGSLNKIPSKGKIPIATLGSISELPKPAITPQAKDNSNKLIWLVIAVAAIVLTFFTYRLVTDMNKSKN